MMQINRSDDILVWFKGPLLYKVSNGKMKFVFPWNVNQITIKSINSFPIYFWGLKGKREITIHEISHDVKVWNPDEKWKKSVKIGLSEITTENIIEQFQCRLPLELPQMNGLLKYNIDIKPFDLSSLTEIQIPDSICTIPKK